MATYFHGSHEIQPETVQTLYLMNPNFAGYSDDAPPPSNMIFMNSPPLTLPQPQHSVGIPVQDSSSPSSIHWTPSQRGLSLSLPVPEIASHAVVHDEEVKALGSQSTALLNSKYLRFAQQLLDEVVSVWKGIRDGSAKGHVKSNGDGDHGERQDESAKRAVELTTVERQELQMKKAKLVNMLDEVGQRYRQYHYQMQIIVSSLEAAAGIGSAKAYTALALQTISKQFRCLQDAITGQIRATAKSLGEEEFVGEGTKSKGSRLQFVDQQVRQQRALQQLGMIHQNAWRPQRGLPERSVSVLRAWLFEHFLHPYPKDSDKQMLAKQTGLTRSQVSNWFINARVRLWKPMVEEMYKEEMKDQEQGNADEKTSENNVKVDSSSKSNACQESSPTRPDQAYPQPPSVSVPPSFTNVYSHTSYGEGHDNMFMQSNLKKARSEESMNRGSEHNNYSFITGSTSHGGGFGEYSVGEIERFGIEQFTPRLSSNSVSLTLGLTQYGNLSLSGAQPSYISGNGIESNGFPGLDNNQSAAHPLNAYENMSIESRKRFAAQLLSDFVA